MGEAQVSRDVLQRDAAAKPVLHPADALHDMVDRLLGPRQRQQVVEIVAAVAGPAQVVRDPGRREALGEGMQTVEVAAVERVGGPDREGDTVEGDREVAADPLQDAQRSPARTEEVLAEHLEPVGGRTSFQDLVEVAGPEPDARAEKGPRGIRSPAFRFGVPVHVAVPPVDAPGPRLRGDAGRISRR